MCIITYADDIFFMLIWKIKYDVCITSLLHIIDLDSSELLCRSALQIAETNFGKSVFAQCFNSG